MLWIKKQLDNTEEQKSHKSKLETWLIHKENQTDRNKEQSERKSEV